ncbi:hypothetical protein like AT2G27260 [Hibiscus trionum]|uniref:Late embryogenesis abundant protein LEA-2 subgroup domain-containing protein n=1 Tax=Hibiscus trionum TaxID=183268 RepID=A0A9W7INI8_HIBTR|nr:hypothetical protein like AT2G27260 [Hibiscus trionum]
MQQSSRTVIGYPAQNANGCAPPLPAAASGTAYPYVYSNTHRYYPAPTPPEYRRPQRIVLISIATFFLIFAIILLILGLVFLPHYPDVSVQSLSLSNFNTSNQHVSASWNAEFRISNPNKKLSITYGDVVSTISHGDYYLAGTRFGPFSQGTGDVKLDANYSVVDSFVDWTVVDAMNGERSRGQVRFNVKAVADMGFQYGGRRLQWGMLRVVCDDVTLTGSSGKMTGGPKRCTVFLGHGHSL